MNKALALPLAILSLLLVTGCNKKGVCVQETNCFANQTKDACDRNGEGFFEPVKDADTAIALCGANGYAFERPDERQKFLDEFNDGSLASIGWTSEEMERRRQAGVCTFGSETPGCKPWTPNAHKSIPRAVDVGK
ncbi:MAG: hypothetical protein R3B13_21780 [Polyangiaceae bacterium]